MQNLLEKFEIQAKFEIETYANLDCFQNGPGHFSATQSVSLRVLL
jgi:hypothetical protein